MSRADPKPPEEPLAHNLGLKPVTFPGIDAEYENRELGYYWFTLKHDPAVKAIQEASEAPLEKQVQAMEAYAELLAEALNERRIKGEVLSGKALLDRFNRSLPVLGNFVKSLGPDPLALAATLEAQLGSPIMGS
jgi:hypothetical protein